jgi:hypothetical protein
LLNVSFTACWLHKIALASSRKGDEMSAEYLLPGSVLLLKLAFKLFVDQTPKLVDTFKALIAFPIDMTFLAFSFGSASLVQAQIGKAGSSDVKMIISLAVFGVLFAFVTTKIARWSDSALDQNKLIVSGLLALVGYFFAVFVVYWSLVVGTLA